MSKRKARHYTEEFKLKAVKLSQVNGNINQTSRELNIPYSVLQRWRKEYDKYGDNSFPGKGKPRRKRFSFQTEKSRIFSKLNY